MDPPYDKDLLEKAIIAIDEKGLLAKDGIVVAEHTKDVVLPETLGGLEKRKRNGTVQLYFPYSCDKIFSVIVREARFYEQSTLRRIFRSIDLRSFGFDIEGSKDL